MTVKSFTKVRTELGTLAIVHGAYGVVRVVLPRSDWGEVNAADLEAAVEDRSPPKEIRELGQAMARHIAGEPQDFSAVLLDTHAVPPFLLRAQRAAQRIPPGQTITYSELAARAGSPHAVRAAGQAMARNRWPILVPCHRVVGCAGYGDYSAASGLHTKLRLLWREGYRGRTSNVGFDEHAAIAHLRTVDVKLRKVIDRAGPFTLYARAPHAMRALPDEEIVQRLVRHHGVEPWQARMWLLFGLGRPDVLPSSDRLLRKGFAISRGLAEIPAASAIEEAGAAWAPFRSVASWYLWRAVELAS